MVARWRAFLVGSNRTVRQGLDGLLRTAAARELLLRAAAARWSVPVAQCHARLGVVHHAASGRRQSCGTLVASPARLTPGPCRA